MDMFEMFEEAFEERFRVLLAAGDWHGLGALVAPVASRFVGPTGHERMIGTQGVGFDALLDRLHRHPKIAHPTIGDAFYLSMRSADSPQTEQLAQVVLLLAVNAFDYLPGVDRSAANSVVTACADFARDELATGLERALDQNRLDPHAYRALLSLPVKDRLRVWFRRHDYRVTDRDGNFTTWMLAYDEIALVFGMKVKGADPTDIRNQASNAARQAHLRATRLFWTRYRNLQG